MQGAGRELSTGNAAEQFDWNLLRTFVTIVEEGSITRAARRLLLSQPAVSAALKRLEDRLGARLIDRRAGRFRVTEAGQTLYRDAAEIRRAVQRLRVALRDSADEVSGHARVAMASHVQCPLFEGALSDFHRAHPRATLAIDVMASRLALEEVLARRAAFAVCLVADRDPRLEYRRLYREFFGLFCGPAHPLFGRADLRLADLEGHFAVSFHTDRPSDALRAVAMLRAEARLDQRIVGTSSHLEEVRRMIVLGLGIGALPVHVAAKDVEAGLLWRLPPHENPPAVDVHVAWHPRAAANRAEEALLRTLIDRIDAVPIERRTYG